MYPLLCTRLARTSPLDAFIVINSNKCEIKQNVIKTNIYLDTSDSASNTILLYEYCLLLVFIVVNKNINLSIVCLNVSLIVLQHSTHVCLYCLNYLLAKGIVVDMLQT